jgi:acyl-CoA synthetase (AMP-forming)/AMP-acid ligase II
MARLVPDEVAWRDLDANTQLTFAQWEAESNRLARGLTRRFGVAAGDRVGLLVSMQESLKWIVAYAAIHKAGAVAVPTNTRLADRELAAIWGHAEVSAAVVSAEFVDRLPPLATTTLVTTAQADWSALVDDDDSEYQEPRDGDDLADIMYTSGTTGLPKGVAVRHRNAATVPNNEPTWSGGGWLFNSPLFTFAGMNFVYNPMKLGMTALFRPKFDAEQWLTDVESLKPGAAFLVPAMVQLVVTQEHFDRADLSSLWLCSIGSAPIAPETLRRMIERLPNASVSNSYGMTEAGAAFCVMPKEEAPKRLGSVGRIMPPAQVKVVDEAGREVPPSTVGEIWMKPAGTLREYYKDPEATARTYGDGWVHTGDLGLVDADGFLSIVGRQKDVIIRGGNNIYPGDVEAVIYEHPAVLEATVVGVPHAVLGEDVAAFVVVRAGAQLTADELRAFCREQLADYKSPRRIVFLDALPRNATGKVVKADLLARVESGEIANNSK